MAIQVFNVGVKAAIIKDDRILIVKHATKGFWDVPGGRIDGDESTKDTLARELAEELPGSRLKNIGETICAYRVPDLTFPDGAGLLLLVYRVELEVPDPVVLSEEHAEARWVTYDEALEIGSHIVKETIKALRQKI